MASDPHSPEPNPSPELIEAAAAAWLSLRDRGLSQAETAEFVRWLQQDPQHAAVFEELDRVWQDCDRLGALPAPSISGAAPDADLLAPRGRARRPRLAIRAVLGLAAAAAVALLIGLPLGPPASRHAAETVRAPMRRGSCWPSSNSKTFGPWGQPAHSGRPSVPHAPGCLTNPT